jgi:predicted TIM-barrel fold metal-dependent hydrolase
MTGMSLEDLEQRVTALETELAVVRQEAAVARALETELALVRQEAAAARALAAGADRDVADYRAELRAHTRTLGALRETQLEHYAEHKADTAAAKADTAEIKAGIAHIVQLLEGLGPNAR